jgi:glycosyltransferase involved in cell wall biosynthesis
VDRLKVAVISKTDSSGGGASRVAADLAVFLNEQEAVSADHWIGSTGNKWLPHMKRLHGGKLLQNVHKACKVFSRMAGFPDYFTPEMLVHWISKDTDYDVYHLHDISTALSPLALSWLSRRKPVVWTFHDSSPFTGGCIYPMDCHNYLDRCHGCPQLREWPMFTRLDFTGTIQKHKHAIVRNSHIQVIAPSAWMAREAVSSGICDHDPVVINYSVDTGKFSDFDKQQLRKELGLPVDKKIVLLSAWSLQDRRKGGMYALEALNKLKSRPFVLMTGHADSQTRELYSEFDIYITGRINDDHKLAKYYASADLFLFPTLADNLPNVVLETMACATPCIAFAVGGVPEMISDGLTGYLVDKYDSTAMAEKTELLLNDDNLRKSFGVAARKRAIEKYGKDMFIDKHIRLYQRIISERAGKMT